MEDWQINIIYSTFGIIVGAVLTFMIARYFYIKQNRDFNKLRESHEKLRAEFQQATHKLFELGKKEKIVYKEPKKETDRGIPAKSWGVPIELQPEPQVKETPSYDLSAGTGTTDPILKDIYDYGKREFGKRIVDSLIESVFGEDDEYVCPECEASVDYEDRECPNCGADLSEE